MYKICLDIDDLPRSTETYDDGILSELFDELFPICRSITGPGLRETLSIFSRYMPLQFESIPSGTSVFDWEVPKEWHIRSARLEGPDGQKILDFSDNNLHVLNYSSPVSKKISLKELMPHLHTIPEIPDAIPYVTSYYKENWGFCMSHEQFLELPKGLYNAFIDSEFVDGQLDYGHCVLKGESEKEILLSSYICHPSMANNELSGPLAILSLYHRIKKWPRRRFTYRFLLNPETIGSLCFLYNHYEYLKDNLEAGLVLTCLGGPGQSLTYKASRRDDGLIDRVMRYLGKSSKKLKVREFTPVSGSDERQYCSPGFNLPVGNIVRSSYGLYPQYHNSLDDKKFMGIDQVIDSVDRIELILKYVEVSGIFYNLKPFGEPHLSKYNLYPHINSSQTRSRSSDALADGRKRLQNILEILSYCDGSQYILDLVERRNLDLLEIAEIIEILEENELLAHHSINKLCQ